MKQVLFPSLVVLYTIISVLLVNAVSTIWLALLAAVCINLVLTAAIKIISPSFYELIEDDSIHNLTRDTVGETLRQTHLIRTKSKQTFAEFQLEVSEIKKEIRGKQ